MKTKILICLVLFAAMGGSISARNYEPSRPRVPEPVIAEATAPALPDPPQTNTFCAAGLACTVTGTWTFSNTATFTGALNGTGSSVFCILNAQYWIGANGCGTGSDIGAQVNAAIAALPTFTYNGSTYPFGVIVIFEKSTAYSLATQIVNQSPFVLIKGSSPDTVTINCPSSPTTCIFENWSGIAFQTTEIANGGLQNLTLVGNGTTNQFGLLSQDAVHLKLENVKFTGFNGTGARGHKMANVNFFHERTNYNRVMFFDNTCGIEMAGGGTGSTNSFGHQFWWDMQWNLLGAESAICFSSNATLYSSFLEGVINTNAGCTSPVGFNGLAGATGNFLSTLFIDIQFDNSGACTPIGFQNQAAQTWRPSGIYRGYSSNSCAGTCGASLGGMDLLSPQAEDTFLLGPVAGIAVPSNAVAQMYNGPAGATMQGNQLDFRSGATGTRALLIDNVQNANFANGVFALTVRPSSAASGDLGSAALSFANLWLGTAATNNFKFQPATTAAARVISMPDPLSNVQLGESLNTGTSVYQSKRGVAGCTTAASIGGTCASDITVTWTTAFADANYSVTCTGSTPTAVPAAPFVVSGTKLAATVHINYFAITAVAASYATIDCIGVHD